MQQCADTINIDLTPFSGMYLPRSDTHNQFKKAARVVKFFSISEFLTNFQLVFLFDVEDDGCVVGRHVAVADGGVDEHGGAVGPDSIACDQ